MADMEQLESLKPIVAAGRLVKLAKRHLDMTDYKPTITQFRKHHMNDRLSMVRSPRCTFADRGVLLSAIDEYWRNECQGLPSDPAKLADEIGCSREEARSMLENTSGYQIIENKIHWQTIEEAYRRALQTRTKNIANGTASAASRALQRSQAASTSQAIKYPSHETAATMASTSSAIYQVAEHINS